MSKKKFTLHETQFPNREGWYEIGGDLPDTLIKSIRNTNGAKASKGVTSVPSPFARIHLMKTAFEYVNFDYLYNQKRHEGNNIYYDLVSQTLDLLEILYTSISDNLGLKLFRWDMKQQVEKLTNSHLDGAQRLGDALSLFSKDPLFNGFESFYLIYRGNRLLGATSPLTLVFPSPTDEKIDASFSNGQYAYFTQIVPLHKRPVEFQRFLHKFFLCNKTLGINTQFETLAQYLRDSLKLNAGLEEEIRSLEMSQDTYSVQKFVSEYPSTLQDEHSNPIQILQYKFHVPQPSTGPLSSDFEILSSKFTGERKPLVLKDKFAGDLNYINGKWNPSIEVLPAQAYHEDIKQRTLPGTTKQYPFVTEGDFLSEYLVELPFNINTEHFLVPGLEGNRFPYLLPITNSYFDYFDINDLARQLSFGITDDPTAGGRVVTATLNIPVRHDNGSTHISFVKKYLVDPVEKRGGFLIHGRIIKAQMGVGIFPFFRTDDPTIDNYYKVMLVDEDTSAYLSNLEGDIQFFKTSDANPIPHLTDQIRKSKQDDVATTRHIELQQRFDYMRIFPAEQLNSNRKVSGVAIARWIKKQVAGEAYSFGVDFGTTNTHVAYNSNPSQVPRPFNISPEECMIGLLHQKGESSPIDLHQDGEFIPNIIGGESRFRFPMRTAVAETPKFSSGQEPAILFGNINIAFTFEKAPVTDNVRTNIKWQSQLDRIAKERIEAYFEEVMILIKNKVIANNGNLKNTKIVWFYPLSFSNTARGNFKTLWKAAHEKILNGVGELHEMTESVAPYLFLTRSNAIRGVAGNALNIDIGGGSTDLLLVVNGQPKYGTSVKFAGNMLWGEGYNQIYHKDNGFLTAYINMRKASNLSLEQEFPNPSTVDSSMLGLLYDMVKDGAQTTAFNSSADMISFIFGLEELLNPKITLSQILIQKPKLKVILYLHFCAIIYHAGQMIRDLIVRKGDGDVVLPRYFIFSGKGSKYLNLLGSPDLLNRVSQHMLQKALEKNPEITIPENFELIIPENPKQATANGGIFSNTQSLKSEIIAHEFLGTNPDFDLDALYQQAAPQGNGNGGMSGGGGLLQMGMLEGIDQGSSSNHLKYTDIQNNQEIKDSVITNVQNCFGRALMFKNVLADKDWMGFDQASLLKIVSVIEAKNYTLLKDSYDMGLAKAVKYDDLVNETLFFLPLAHTLYELSKEVVNM